MSHAQRRQDNRGGRPRIRPDSARDMAVHALSQAGFSGAPRKAGRGTWQSGDDGKRSVHAPLPRLWRTHDRLSLPCVLGEAAQEGRLQPQ